MTNITTKRQRRAEWRSLHGWERWGGAIERDVKRNGRQVLYCDYVSESERFALWRPLTIIREPILYCRAAWTLAVEEHDRRAIVRRMERGGRRYRKGLAKRARLGTLNAKEARMWELTQQTKESP